MKKLLPLFLLFIASAGLSAQTQSPAVTPTAGTLTVTSTISSGGTITAVWIDDATGTFVRTLYAGSSSGYVNELSTWSAESNQNVVNATTGATKSSIWALSYSWNGKDKTNTTLLADGTYTVKIENARQDVSPVVVTASFTKGAASQTVTASNKAPITNVTVKWVPSSTGLNEIKLGNLYSVYPNPTRSTIFVNGFDIQSITIYTLAGKQLIRSVEPRIDLSALDKGVYLAQISTSRGTFAKKVVKE
jgi:hypothetical protein